MKRIVFSILALSLTATSAFAQTGSAQVNLNQAPSACRGDIVPHMVEAVRNCSPEEIARNKAAIEMLSRDLEEAKKVITAAQQSSHDPGRELVGAGVSVAILGYTAIGTSAGAVEMALKQNGVKFERKKFAALAIAGAISMVVTGWAAGEAKTAFIELRQLDQARENIRDWQRELKARQAVLDMYQGS